MARQEQSLQSSDPFPKILALPPQIQTPSGQLEHCRHHSEFRNQGLQFVDEQHDHPLRSPIRITVSTVVDLRIVAPAPFQARFLVPKPVFDSPPATGESDGKCQFRFNRREHPLNHHHRQGKMGNAFKGAAAHGGNHTRNNSTIRRTQVNLSCAAPAN